MRKFNFLVLLVLLGLFESCQWTVKKQDACEPVSLDFDLLSRLQNVSDNKETIMHLSNDSLEALLFQTKHSKSSFCDTNLNLRIAVIHDSIGKRYYRAQKYDKAKGHYEKALKLRKKVLKNPFGKPIIRMYLNIGAIEQIQGNYLASIAYYDSAGSRVNEDIPVIYFLAKTRNCTMKLNSGEWYQAYHYIKNAYDLLDKYSILEKYRLDIIKYYILVCRHLKKFKEGISIATNEIEYQKENYKELVPNKSVADLYIVISNIWQDSLLVTPKNPIPSKKAHYFLQKSLNYYQNSSATIKSKREALIALNLGELFRRQNQYEKAEIILSNAISNEERIKYNQSLARMYVNRGETFFDRKYLSKAMIDYDSALNFYLPQYSINSNKEIPPINKNTSDQNDFILLLSNIALTHMALYEQTPTQPSHLQNAITVYDSLLQFINRTRGDFVSDESKLLLAENAQPILRKAFEACIKLHQATEDDKYLHQAFAIAEQSKAFTLLEASRLQNLSSELPAEIREQERQLLQEQANIQDALIEAYGDDEKTQEQKENSLKNFESISAFQKGLKEKFPKYYQVKYQGATYSVKDVQQKLLEPNQCLIEYFFIDSALYIMAINSQEFKVESVPISQKEVALKVKEFRSLLELSPDITIQESENNFAELGHELYELLMAPVSDLLSERLVIIPTGVLNNLAFEALVTQLSEASEIKELIHNESLLLFKHAISYCFSANMLAEMKAINARKDSKVAILQTHFHSELNKNTASQNLPPDILAHRVVLKPLGIPQKQEIEGVKKHAHRSKIYADATKKDFFDACENYSIVHVPTHGIVNEVDPSRSFVAFSQMGDTLNNKELLYIKELHPYNWGLDLVFLSACQTASGKYYEGEGNMSMARGLALAGVKCFITTLWDAPTSTKAAIAEGFYKRFLQEKLPKDVALTLAKREAAKKRPHPSEWASLIMIGSNNN